MGFSDLLEGLDILLKEPLDERTTAHYLEALDDIHDRDAAIVAKQCVRDWSKFPKPAQIRKSAEKIGVTFRGDRPVTRVDDSEPLPPRGSDEWAEGKARMGLWSILTRSGQDGLAAAVWLGREDKIREAYIQDITGGHSTLREAAREAIEVYRGIREMEAA
jgi:hypothetical protein